VTDDERRAAFAQAFLAQARSDWRGYKLLTAYMDPEDTPLPVSHRLHYLQMACEKLAKAYRLRDTGAQVDEITEHHTGFAKFIASYLSSPAFKPKYEKKSAQLASIIKVMRAMATTVERLAPARDRKTYPSNAEYPWEDASKVIAPCDYGFRDLDLNGVPQGRNFLKLLEGAFRNFESVKLP
jgi:hypothetical protein